LKVSTLTAGPTGGAVPNAGGAPGVAGTCVEETCPAEEAPDMADAMAAPAIPIELFARNSLLDFAIGPSSHTQVFVLAAMTDISEDIKPYRTETPLDADGAVSTFQPSTTTTAFFPWSCFVSASISTERSSPGSSDT
jgi:hypothetical protein